MSSPRQSPQRHKTVSSLSVRKNVGNNEEEDVAVSCTATVVDSDMEKDKSEETDSEDDISGDNNDHIPDETHGEDSDDNLAEYTSSQRKKDPGQPRQRQKNFITMEDVLVCRAWIYRSKMQ